MFINIYKVGIENLKTNVLEGPPPAATPGLPSVPPGRQGSGSEADTARCPVPAHHSGATCVQRPQTENSMPGGIWGSFLQFFLLGKKIDLLQTLATAVYVTVALVYRMFVPLVCLISLILDLYSDLELFINFHRGSTPPCKDWCPRH